jgi:hypothetical protein
MVHIRVFERHQRLAGFSTGLQQQHGPDMGLEQRPQGNGLGPGSMNKGSKLSKYQRHKRCERFRNVLREIASSMDAYDAAVKRPTKVGTYQGRQGIAEKWRPVRRKHKPI